MCRMCYNDNRNRGMDVKNLTPSRKVTIQAPSYFNLRRAGVGDAEVLSAPLFF